MKKALVSIIVLVLVMTAALTLLTACKDKTDYEHTIVFYSSQGDNLQKITTQAIAKFEAKYPGWTVKHEKPGGYPDVEKKIISDFQVHQQPDVAYCYADHVAGYLQTGKVINMNTLINSTEKIEGHMVGYTAEELRDFVPNYWAEGLAKNWSDYASFGYSENDMITLPFVRSTELLYVNKTALDECGLTVATTWEELWQQAPVIKQKYAKATPLGYDSEANWFITMCAQQGWGYTSVSNTEHYLWKNNTALNTWLETINSYWDKKWVTTQSDYGGYTSNLFTMGAEAGGIIYCVGSSGGASYQATTKFTWEVHPIPGSATGAGDKNAVISQGPSLVMLKSGHDVSNADEKQKMTFLFIKELLDPTFQASFASESGYNPVRYSTYDNPEFAEFLESGSIIAEAIKAGQQCTEHQFTSPAFDGSSTARDQVGTALLEIMQGHTDAADALNTAYINCGGKNL